MTRSRLAVLTTILRSDAVKPGTVRVAGHSVVPDSIDEADGHKLQFEWATVTKRGLDPTSKANEPGASWRILQAMVAIIEPVRVHEAALTKAITDFVLGKSDVLPLADAAPPVSHFFDVGSPRLAHLPTIEPPPLRRLAVALREARKATRDLDAIGALTLTARDRDSVLEQLAGLAQRIARASLQAPTLQQRDAIIDRIEGVLRVFEFSIEDARSLSVAIGAAFALATSVQAREKRQSRASSSRSKR